MMKHTEIVGGKRQWVKSPYVEEMRGRYRLSIPDSAQFFEGVLKTELSLEEGDFTSFLGVYQKSSNHSLVVGGKVCVFPFEGNNWVVKYGAYERVVEDMGDLFEIIREAWVYYD